MPGFNLLANIKNIPAVQGLFGLQSSATNAMEANDQSYQNNNSGLRNAQKQADARMKNNKAKLPMVLEYYESAGNRMSVEMYINPSRLTMQTAKIKAKAVTRGGIFYHHWGDDHWTMSISGTTGFSGMKGIEQLENLYAYSGTLLVHQSTAAPRHAGSMDLFGSGGLLGMLQDGNLAGAMGYIMNHNLKDELVKTAKGFVAKTATNMFNNLVGKPLSDQMNANAARDKAVAGLPANATAEMRSQANKVQSSGLLIDTMSNVIGFAQRATGMTNGAGGAANNAFNLGSLAGMALRGIIGDKLGLQDHNSQVVDFGQAQSGWSDISDELEDIWRPRQIWIYFEDRVYIGHFDSFSYQRVAETPLINYEMRFTVTRQVIVDAFNPVVPEFKPSSLSYAGNSGKIGGKPANVLKSIFDSRGQTLQAVSLTAGAIINGLPIEDWQTKIKRYETKTPDAISEAKAEILKSKESYVHEKEIAELNGTVISEQRKSQIDKWCQQVRTAIGMPHTDLLYGEQMLTTDQRLYYYSLAQKGTAVSGEPKPENKEALEAAQLEINYIKAQFTKLKTTNKLTPLQAKELYSWLEKVHEKSGIATKEAWEEDLKKLVPNE